MLGRFGHALGVGARPSNFQSDLSFPRSSSQEMIYMVQAVFDLSALAGYF